MSFDLKLMIDFRQVILASSSSLRLLGVPHRTALFSVAAIGGLFSLLIVTTWLAYLECLKQIADPYGLHIHAYVFVIIKNWRVALL